LASEETMSARLGFPRTRKALAFLSMGETVDQIFRSGMTDLTAWAAGVGADLRLWSRLPSSLLGTSPQGNAGPDTSRLHFIVETEVVEQGASDEELRDILVHIGQLNGVLPDSQILAGVEYAVVPGGGDCALFCPLFRRPELSEEQFSDYWINVHSGFGLQDMSRGYRQLHPDAAVNRSLALAAGLTAAPFDGVAEAYFADLATMQAKLLEPANSLDAYEDEQRFIDHSRSSFVPFERVR
jgi:hypothetical protein